MAAGGEWGDRMTTQEWRDALTSHPMFCYVNGFLRIGRDPAESWVSLSDVVGAYRIPGESRNFIVIRGGGIAECPDYSIEDLLWLASQEKAGRL